MNEKLKIKALEWMDKNFSLDQLEVFLDTNYPESIFYKKNGKMVMEQENKNKRFWFDDNNIWSIFEEFFGINYSQTQSVMKDWLEQTLKLGGFTPLKCRFLLS